MADKNNQEILENLRSYFEQHWRPILNGDAEWGDFDDPEAMKEFALSDLDEALTAAGFPKF